MFEWSDTDLMVRDAVRQFVDKEIRPNLDELESGQLSPYPIARKLFSQFGLDAMAAESVKKMLDRERAKQSGERAPENPENQEKQDSSDDSGGMGAQGSMVAVLISEVARVSIGLLSTVGVSLGLGATTIMSRGTLAQKERWLPELMTLGPTSSGMVRITSSTDRRPSSPTGRSPTYLWSTPSWTRAWTQGEPPRTRRRTSATDRCWCSCWMRGCRA